MRIDKIFLLAKEKRASDIHIVSDQVPFLRIDGHLYSVSRFIKNAKPITEAVLLELLSHNEREEFFEEKELDISYQVEGDGRYRINYFWEKGKVALAARIISSKIPTLEQIRIPEVVKSLLELKQGLILVTGATGSGKSTTMASMLEYINQHRKVHIATIEDPVEYLFKSEKSFFTQRQVGDDTTSFANALKHVFRQDPDVIMVGEMRDLETIGTTITLAETGHLVFSTLHTHTAAQTIDRIIDVFPPYQQSQVRLQLSMTLKGIVSQRLIEKVNGGRVANWEVLINNIAVANTIRENKIEQINNIIQTSAAEGMITAKRDLKEMFDQGLIDQATYDYYKERSYQINNKSR